ncbi:hypothetical protein HMPREF2898_04940 [Atopobium sp. HMSC064B08]|nr:hypothetical protein HMPREF2898_04940 [Atopobium sp. HMSC064B08]
MFKVRDTCFWPFLYGRYLKLFGYLSAAKLAASWAVQAILGAFLAALGSMIMLVRSSRFIVGSLKLCINGCL